MRVKTKNYVPKHLHHALQWSDNDPLSIFSHVEDLELPNFTDVPVISEIPPQKATHRRKQF